MCSSQYPRHRTLNLPIEPQERLAITLRYLAGGAALDLVDIAPVSLSHVYCIISQCLHAINDCDQLRPEFGVSVAGCEQRATAFRARSANGQIFSGVDGLFVRTKVSTSTHAGSTTVTSEAMLSTSRPYAMHIVAFWHGRVMSQVRDFSGQFSLHLVVVSPCLVLFGVITWTY